MRHGQFFGVAGLSGYGRFLSKCYRERAERPSHGGAIFDWQSGSTYWEVANSLWRVGPLGRTVSGWCWVDEFGHGKNNQVDEITLQPLFRFFDQQTWRKTTFCFPVVVVCVCVSGFTRACARIFFDDCRVFDLNKCRKTLDANQHGITWNMLKRLVPLPGGNQCPWPRSSAAVGTDCGITFHAFEEKMADPAVRCWVKNMRYFFCIFIIWGDVSPTCDMGTIPVISSSHQDTVYFQINYSVSWQEIFVNLPGIWTMKTAGIFYFHYTRNNCCFTHCPGEYFETLGINVYDTWLPLRLLLGPSAMSMDYHTCSSCLDLEVLNVD